MPADHTTDSPLEPVVQITYCGRVYTCRIELEGPLAFWRVETPGLPPHRSFLRAMGGEQPVFFEFLAQLAARAHGLE